MANLLRKVAFKHPIWQGGTVIIKMNIIDGSSPSKEVLEPFFSLQKREAFLPPAIGAE
jgi:hypothetical protein